MTGDDQIRAAVERLLVASPDCCDRPALDNLVADSARLRSWLDAFDTRIALRARVLEREGRSESPHEVLSNRGRRSSAESRAASKRAGVCDQHPNFHDALNSGEISAGHVDALGRASSRLSPPEKAAFDDRGDDLLAAAKGMTVDEFSRECQATARECSEDDGLSDWERQRKRRTISRRKDEETGMVITRIELDPLTDERMWNSIDRATKARLLSGDVPDGEGWDHVAVDFVVDRITGATTSAPTSTYEGDAPAEAEVTLFPMPAAGDPADANPADADGAADEPSGAEVFPAESPDVIVLIDWDALAGAADDAGLLSETLGGIPVPVATVRRLCCQARIIPMVLNGAGVALDVGRDSRLATTDQRRALAAMYATCAYPGCGVRFEHCKIHHSHQWHRDHGRTDLALLVPLCDRHHHLVHEGGWQLEVHPDRTITITRPDGGTHYHGPSLNRRRRRPPPAA